MGNEPDNLRNALTGAGVGAILLEVVRRVADAWQKRQQQKAEELARRNTANQDAAAEVRRLLQAQIDELRSTNARIQQDASDHQRRATDQLDELRRHVDELEERSDRERRASAEFAAVVSVLLPEIAEPHRGRLGAALERWRQVSGLG